MKEKKADVPVIVKRTILYYRIAAFVVDTLLVSLLSFLVNLITQTDSYAANNNLFVAYLMYSFLTTGLFSATIGKQLFLLKVVGEERQHLTWKQVFIREFVGKGISAVPYYVGTVWGVLDYGWPFFNRKRKALHDILAKTYLIQTRNAGLPRKIAAAALIIILVFIMGTYIFMNLAASQGR